MGEEPERLRALHEALLTEYAHLLPPDASGYQAAEWTLAHKSLTVSAALLAEVERLAGERDAAVKQAVWLAGLNTKKQAECERLAGRVAALETALQRIADNDIPALVLSDPIELTIDAEPRDAVYVEKQSAARFARAVLADVGGSE